MRYSLLALLLLALNSTVFAQTRVPFTFTSGTVAKASEVNADFSALATAIDNLTARVSKLEGQFTAADVAGTYAFVSLEVEVGAGGGSASIHHATGNGNLTLGVNGTVSGSITYKNANLGLGVSTIPAGGGQSSTTLTATVTTVSSSESLSATWSLSGKILTLNFSSFSVEFISAAGPSLFMSAINSKDQKDQSLVFLMRTN